MWRTPLKRVSLCSLERMTRPSVRECGACSSGTYKKMTTNNGMTTQALAACFFLSLYFWRCFFSSGNRTRPSSSSMRDFAFRLLMLMLKRCQKPGRGTILSSSSSSSSSDVKAGSAPCEESGGTGSLAKGRSGPGEEWRRRGRVASGRSVPAMPGTSQLPARISQDLSTRPRTTWGKCARDGLCSVLVYSSWSWSWSSLAKQRRGRGASKSVCAPRGRTQAVKHLPV